jgi:hypothetical protein
MGDFKLPTWTEVAKSFTSDINNTQRKVVPVDVHYLVVGFEVNSPTAFKDEVHNLDDDYGHAFFYTVKNGLVTGIFSFGPAGDGKVGWLNKGGSARTPNAWNSGALFKDGYADSRLGTADYAVGEATKLFKLSLTQEQHDNLQAAMVKWRKRIESGAEKYTAYINDTCAETAKSVLDDADIETPSGKGAISKFGYNVFYGTNPYRWHADFLKAGYREVIQEPRRDEWKAKYLLGKSDPAAGQF